MPADHSSRKSPRSTSSQCSDTSFKSAIENSLGKAFELQTLTTGPANAVPRGEARVNADPTTGKAMLLEDDSWSTIASCSPSHDDAGRAKDVHQSFEDHSSPERTRRKSILKSPIETWTAREGPCHSRVSPESVEDIYSASDANPAEETRVNFFVSPMSTLDGIGSYSIAREPEADQTRVSPICCSKPAADVLRHSLHVTTESITDTICGYGGKGAATPDFYPRARRRSTLGNVWDHFVSVEPAAEDIWGDAREESATADADAALYVSSKSTTADSKTLGADSNTDGKPANKETNFLNADVAVTPSVTNILDIAKEEVVDFDAGPWNRPEPTRVEVTTSSDDSLKRAEKEATICGANATSNTEKTQATISGSELEAILQPEQEKVQNSSLGLQARSDSSNTEVQTFGTDLQPNPTAVRKQVNISSVDACAGIKPAEEAITGSCADLRQRPTPANQDCTTHGHDSSAPLGHDTESNRRSLLTAVREGDAREIRNLLDQGVSCNARDFAPLHHAIRHGHVEIAKLLIHRGADIRQHDSGFSTPLLLAVAAGDASLVKLLVDKGAALEAPGEREQTPPILGAGYGHIKIMKILINNGAEVASKNDKPTVLSYAVQNGRVDAARFLINSGAGASETYRASRWTPLHLAAGNDFLELAELLIENGADLASRTDSGETPLHKAAYKGHTEVMNLLLTHGANVMSRNKRGETPLHSAAFKGRRQAVELLISHGADIMSKSMNGSTPLHDTVVRGHAETTRLFVNSGADLTSQNGRGHTPLKTAISGGHGHLAEILIDELATRFVSRFRLEELKPIVSSVAWSVYTNIPRCLKSHEGRGKVFATSQTCSETQDLRAEMILHNGPSKEKRALAAGGFFQIENCPWQVTGVFQLAPLSELDPRRRGSSNFHLFRAHLTDDLKTVYFRFQLEGDFRISHNKLSGQESHTYEWTNISADKETTGTAKLIFGLSYLGESSWVSNFQKTMKTPASHVGDYIAKLTLPGDDSFKLKFPKEVNPRGATAAIMTTLMIRDRQKAGAVTAEYMRNALGHVLIKRRHLLEQLGLGRYYKVDDGSSRRWPA